MGDPACEAPIRRAKLLSPQWVSSVRKGLTTRVPRNLDFVTTVRPFWATVRQCLHIQMGEDPKRNWTMSARRTTIVIGVPFLLLTGYLCLGSLHAQSTAQSAAVPSNSTPSQVLIRCPDCTSIKRRRGCGRRSSTTSIQASRRLPRWPSN